MKTLLENKLIMGLLVLILLGGIYTFATGGFGGSGGDLPELQGAGGAPPPQTSSTATTTPPSTGGAATSGSEPSLAAGAPASGAVSAGIGKTGATPTPTTPSPGDGATKPSTPTPSSGGDAGISGKLDAFRNMNPDKILKDKYDELNKEVTPPEHFAEDIGRVDPLTVVNDFIPEELRPPREGETNEEEVFKFLEELFANEMLDSIQIQVQEVLSIGNYKSVVAIIQGQTMNVPEDGQIPMPDSPVLIWLYEVTSTKVTFKLIYQGNYATVTRDRIFISGSY